MPKLLVTSRDVPGWGGASTRAYLLFEKLQRDGWDVGFINLIKDSQEEEIRHLFGDSFGNPRSLSGVHTSALREPTWETQPELRELILSSAPRAILAFGFNATLAARSAAPGVPLTFMTVGSRVEHLVETGVVRDFMDFEGRPDTAALDSDRHDREPRAVEGCDRIIVHSPLVRFAFDHRFPGARDKIHPRTISLADLSYDAAREAGTPRTPFAARDIDLLFVASDWARPMKNYALVREIAARLPELRTHVVGAYDAPCPHAVHHGVVPSRLELFTLLGRCKTLACPSLLDAAPNVLFEASAMGCNVVATRNCGNWELCNDELLAERCTADDFVECIRRSLSHAHADNRDRFRGGYDALVEALNRFQRISG